MSTLTPSRPLAPRPGPVQPRPARPAGTARTLDPFRVLRRHMLLLVAAGLGGVCLGVGAHVVCSLFFPLYAGEVTFEIRAGLDEATDVGSQDAQREDVVARHAATESMLATSRPILEVAVKQRDVQNTRWFQEHYVDHHGARVDDAVDELEEDVNGRFIPGTNLFTLNWRAPVPYDVPVVLNAIADAYIERRDTLNNTSFARNHKVFSEEFDETSRKLDDLGREIEQFIREKGITSLDDPRSTTLASELSKLIERVGEAASNLRFAQSAYVQTSAKLEGTVAPTEEDRRLAEQAPAVLAVDQQVLGMKAQIRALRDRYRDPGNPLIEKAENNLRAMEQEYEAKVQEIMTENLRAQLKNYSNQIESLKASLEQMEKEEDALDQQLRLLTADMATLQAKETQREHLEQTRDLAQELIQSLNLLRLRDDSKRVQILTQALTPREKAFPRLEIVVPLVTMLILGGVTGLVFLRELTDQRVKSAADLEMVSGARVVGMIPDLEEDPCRSTSAELVVRRCPTSVLAESYRQAWNAVDKGMARHGHRTLLLAGGLPETGTTTVATNLAAAASATGKRVALVEANLRRPRLAAAMGVASDAPGLGDVLAGEASPEEALQRAECGVDVIGAGRPQNRVFERISNGKIDALLAVLRDRYDLVLVDAPPAVVAGDALAVASKVDAAVLVVRANQEQRGLVARLLNQLNDARCEVLGVVLNRPRFTAGGYFKKNFATMARYASAPPAR